MSVSNPINYLLILATVLVTAASGYGLHSCSIQRLEEQQSKAIIAQQKEHEKAIAAEKLACVVHEQKNQSITTGASNVFQSGLTQLDHDYADVMQQRSCVSIIDASGATGRPDAGTGNGKPVNHHAVDSQDLYGFARQCELDRLRVIGLQKFILDERR